MRSGLVLAMHAYRPKKTEFLTKYYRNHVTMVNGIITKSYMCIELELETINIKINCKLARI